MSEPNAIESTLSSMFARARYEAFDSGMHYQFYDELEAVVYEHGRDAIRAILNMVMAGKVSKYVLCPTLRELGRYEDGPARGARFVLLTAMLYHDAPEVRDAAGLGLYDMGDKRAIPFLDDVIEDEQIGFLRRCLTQERDYLAGAIDERTRYNLPVVKRASAPAVNRLDYLTQQVDFLRGQQAAITQELRWISEQLQATAHG